MKKILLFICIIFSVATTAQKSQSFLFVNDTAENFIRSVPVNSLVFIADSAKFYLIDNIKYSAGQSMYNVFSDGNYTNIISMPNVLDSIRLNPNIPQIGFAFTEYTLKGDSLTKLIAFNNGFGNVNYINSAISIPFVNVLPDTLKRGTPVSGDLIDVSKGRNLPCVAITDITDINSARSFGGLVRDDTPPGGVGIIQRLNFLLGYNTSGMSLRDPVYVAADSTLVNIPAEPPFYTVFVGRVVVVDAVNGVIEVIANPFSGSDTDANLQGILNGIIVQKQAIRDTIISNILYFETFNEENPLIDLPFMSNKIRYNLNTTTNTGFNGYARVALNYGTATSAQKNYIYIDNTGTPTLAVSTTAFPAAGIQLGECLVYDQATHEARGFGNFQRFNNAIDGTIADGWVSKSGKRTRFEGSIYESPGINPTVTIVTDAGVLDSLKVTTDAGIIWQFNRQTFDAQPGGKYLWLNSPTGERFINDLNEVDSTELGIDLHGGNNRRYGLNIFAIQNSEGFDDHLAVTSPTDFYSTDQNAIDDVNQYAVTSVLSKYSKTSVRLFRIVVNYSTTANGTLTNLEGVGGFQDERGEPLGSRGTSGGSVGSQVNFPDTDFTIFNNADPTKIIQFDASNITAGNTRTLTAPDVSDTLLTRGDLFGTNVNLTGILDVSITGSGVVSKFNMVSAARAFISYRVGGVDKGELAWNTNFAGDGVGTEMTLKNIQGDFNLWDNTNSGIKLSGGDVYLTGKISITGIGGSVIIGDGAGIVDDLIDNNNNWIGLNVGNKNLSGFGNTVNGAESYKNGVRLSNNTIIGSSSANIIFSGADNDSLSSAAYLGVGIKSRTNNETNVIAIGANVITNGSNTATVGDDNITDIYMAEDSSANIHAAIGRFNGKIVTQDSLRIEGLSFFREDIRLDSALIYSNTIATKIEPVISTDFGGFQDRNGIGIVSEQGDNRQAFLFTDATINQNAFTISTSTNTGVDWLEAFMVSQLGGVKSAGKMVSGDSLRVDSAALFKENITIDGGVGSIANGLRFGDGDTGIFEVTDDELVAAVGGREYRFSFGSDGLFYASSTYWQLRNEQATATNPNIIPDRGDTDTGVGWTSADIGSLVAGGTNVLNWNTSGVDINGTAINMITSGAVLTVGVGADNGIVSAGTFTDRTKYFDGDGLIAIKNIKGDNGEIDHSSLPEFARVHHKKDTLILGEIITIEENDAFEIVSDTLMVSDSTVMISKEIYSIKDGKSVKDTIIEAQKIQKIIAKKQLKKGIKFDSKTGEFNTQSQTKEKILTGEEGRDLGAMISILTKAVQQLTALNEAQQIQIDSLLIRVDNLEK